MDTEVAVGEFVAAMRVGSAALKQIVSNDAAASSTIEPELNELLDLLDRFDGIRDRISKKFGSAGRKAIPS